MATDNLIQLGGSLAKTHKDVSHTTRRVAENFPMLERTRDEIAADFTFYQEFYIYHDKKHLVLLNLIFEEEFEFNPLVFHIDVPKTFTTDDIGVWVPVGWLGDLNFDGGFNYSEILSYTSSGSFTMDFKVVWELGAVDVSSLVTYGINEAIIPLNYVNLLDPPATIMKNVYVYGMLTSLSGTLYVSAATYFQNNFVYSPRLIGV